MDKLEIEDLDETTHISITFTASPRLELTAHVGAKRHVYREDGYLEFSLTAGTSRDWSLKDTSNFSGATITGWAYPMEKVSKLFERRCNLLRAHFHAQQLKQTMDELKEELYSAVPHGELCPVQLAQASAWLWEKRQRWEIDSPQPPRGERVKPLWFGINV